jgi:hypothetical protein
VLIVEASYAPTQTGGLVAYYRVYFLDGLSGHIKTFREFEASDDADAIMIAEGWRESQAMELWEKDRKVQSWPASS